MKICFVPQASVLNTKHCGLCSYSYRNNDILSAHYQHIYVTGETLIDSILKRLQVNKIFPRMNVYLHAVYN